MIIEATEEERQLADNKEWNNADLNTPFVQSILADFAKSNKLSMQEVQDKFKEDLEKTKAYLSETPVMSGTALKGVVEQVLFNYLPDVSEEQFDVKTINTLFTYIMGTYSGYFPLRNSTGQIITPSIHVTPSVFPQPEYFREISTAAASPEGDVIFNSNFAKQLIYYGRKKGITGKAKYYVSNGGDLPDEYAYLEFLIRHEFFHILRSDNRRIYLLEVILEDSGQATSMESNQAS